MSFKFMLTGDKFAQERFLLADCQISGSEEFQVLLPRHACSAQCTSYEAGFKLEADSTYGASYFVAKGRVSLVLQIGDIASTLMVLENQWFELPVGAHFVLFFEETSILLELVFDPLDQLREDAG